MERRFVMFAAILAVLVAVAVWTQVTIAPAPAQMMKPKITGRVVDKTLHQFTDLGIPGIKSVKHARLTLGPNAKIEPMVSEEGADLCEARTGTINVTLEDGKKVSHKGGDFFIIPYQFKAKAVQAGPRGYDEFYWRIVPAK